MSDSDTPKSIRELRNEYIAGRKTGVIGGLQQKYIDEHPIDPNRKHPHVQWFRADDPQQNNVTRAALEAKYGRTNNV